MTGRHIRSPSRQAKGRGAPRPAGGSSGSGRRREAGRGQAGDPGHWPGGSPAPAGPGHRRHPHRDLCVATAALAVCRRLPRPEEDIKSHLPLCFSKVESISDPLPHENHVNVLLFISDEARRPAVRERRLAPISAAARRLPRLSEVAARRGISHPARQRPAAGESLGSAARQPGHATEASRALGECLSSSWKKKMETFLLPKLKKKLKSIGKSLVSKENTLRSAVLDPECHRKLLSEIHLATSKLR